jgi:hypothetical protein
MTLDEIEIAVSKLSPEGLARFSTWFDEFYNDTWDRQIERDIKAGKLNKFAKDPKED